MWPTVNGAAGGRAVGEPVEFGVCVRFGLLGPLTVGGEPVGGGKVRSLLAALLMRPGRVVPSDDLKLALWGDEPPASATASLHNHVARLRRLLDSEDRVRAVPPGYVLRVDPGELDTEVFEAHARVALAAHNRGDWPVVAEETAAALALWRGAPLSGLYDPADGEPALVQRLGETRLLVLEWKYEAELRLGRHEGIGPELAALTGQFPLREAFHRQLMLVLHRTGRQAEALAVHQRLRRTLVEELGVDPGPAVQEAHREILREPAPRAELPTPAQLPPGPAHFTGRDDLVAQLRAALTQRRQPEAPAARHEGAPTAALAVITGMAGVGKSALAVHVAHALREEFPDGQLYLNLRGATPGLPPLPPIQALAALLNALGVDSRNVPDTPDAAAALLRSRLAPTRTLLVLDDAASAAQVRPLLPAGDGCAVVVTSRSPLAALDGATRFPLAPMTADESLGLLRAVSGRQLADGAARLVELCGRLPLALRVAAARLAARRALSPDALAGLLDAEDGRLDHLEYDDLSVRRSLAVALGALDPDAALALRRLGALDLPAYEVPVVARLMGLPEQRAGAALDRLVEVALLEEISYGRYAPHDLVRDFARELAAQDDGREAAVERGLRWYAEAARQSGLALSPPEREGPARVPEPVGDAEPFPDTVAALAWGDRELPAVVTLTERYARSSPTVFLLVRAYFSHLQYRGKYGALRHLNRFVLSAARASGDLVAQAHALGDLAGAHFLASRIEEALALNDEAIALWQELGERGRTQRTLANRGMLLERLGRHAEAAEPLEWSLALTRELDDAYGEAIILSHLGNLHEHTDARVAIAYHERSLATGCRIGSELLVHTAHCNIGYAHLTLGEWAAAVGHFERALCILGDQGDWHGRSQSWVGLVRVLGELGRTDEAYAACADLLDQAVERCDGYSEGLGRREYGRLERSRGRIAQARVQWELALTALEGGDPKAHAEVTELLAGLDEEPGVKSAADVG
ncbi:BTAD domain-containing putative transcriptional regulator [Streptomyces noboritoensis]|uniref:BTAD domain-containing putative transcriptional regulator n=1 Tax=Streptomyces noboritoensis TaxID=67337 RepID=A0ABV6TMI6_9ACTN